MEVDWNGKHNGLTEDYKDYFSVSEPSISLSNGKLNPAVYAVFDKNDQLINFSVSYLCDSDKDIKTKNEILEKLTKNAFPCLGDIKDKEKYKESHGNYFESFQLNNSANNYWTYTYEIGLIEKE